MSTMHLSVITFYFISFLTAMSDRNDIAFLKGEASRNCSSNKMTLSSGSHEDNDFFALKAMNVSGKSIYSLNFLKIYHYLFILCMSVCICV